SVTQFFGEARALLFGIRSCRVIGLDDLVSDFYLRGTRRASLIAIWHARLHKCGFGDVARRGEFRLADWVELQPALGGMSDDGYGRPLDGCGKLRIAGPGQQLEDAWIAILLAPRNILQDASRIIGKDRKEAAKHDKELAANLVGQPAEDDEEG